MLSVRHPRVKLVVHIGVAAERGPEKVERGRRWGSAKAGSQLGVVTEKLGVVRKFNVVRTLSLTL